MGVALPLHCPPSRDNRTWAIDERETNRDTRHNTFLHETSGDMYDHFWAWIEASLAYLRRQPGIARAAVPSPKDPSASLDVGLIDSSTATVIVGLGQVRGHEAEGAYVGLVVQEPFGTWRGLSGFYLSWCPACDRGGNQAIRRVRSELTRRAVALKSIWDMPAALHPREGWFDNERLLFGRFISERPGLNATWQTLAQRIDTPALIATGPVMSNLANLVLVDSLALEAPVLRALLGSGGAWSMRFGDTAALELLADIGREATIGRMSATRPGNVPAAWGAYRLDGEAAVFGPFPNLWRTLREVLDARPGDPRHFADLVHLPVGRAVRLADVLALTPALSP